MDNQSIINLFIKYAKIYSPSRFEKEFAQTLVEDLNELGAEIVFDSAGEKVGSNTGNLIAYIKGSISAPPILLSAHMDTVVPCENIDPVVDGDRIISKGETILSGDDKAGIAAIIEAIKYAKENNIPHRDIEIAFTICEEVGLLGSKYLDYSLLKSNIGYVLDGGGEPGGMYVKAPAHADIKAEFTGLAKHAGLEPEKGISAIQMAAEAITNMRLLRIDEETSANVGTIHGGLADNIVAEKCSVTFEARSLSNEKLNEQIELMMKAIKSAADKFGGSVNIEHDQYGALSLTDDNPAITLFKKACEKSSFTFSPTATGGGSDASNFYSHGINCPCIGIGMQNVHSTNEFILIEDLVNSANLILSIITTV